MVSRRKILSRSRDDLTFDDEPTFHKKFEEDTFYSQEKLYKVISELLQNPQFWSAAKSMCFGKHMLYVP